MAIYFLWGIGHLQVFFLVCFLWGGVRGEGGGGGGGGSLSKLTVFFVFFCFVFFVVFGQSIY